LMVILTEAFKRGIDMFRTLRAQGQLQEKLRMATVGLRDDLASFHFQPTVQNPNANQYYLAGWRFDHGSAPPPEGFCRIYQGPEANSAFPFIAEGADPD